MKIVQQLMDAMLVAQEAQAKVNRIVAEIEAKADGRRMPKKRRARKKRASPKAD